MEQASKETILVVNDTPDQLRLIDELLRQAGYITVTARDGQEGFERAESSRPDLIISDVIMPGIDGIELCRLIRATASLRQTPFLLVSALRRDDETVLEGLEAGADDYLRAPYNPPLLIAKVARLLERKRMDDDRRQLLQRERAARAEAEIALRSKEEWLQALSESEERFRATFDQAAVGIAHVAADGRWLRVNQRLCDIVGYTESELLQSTFQTITHPDDLDADLTYVQHMLEGEIKTYSMEKRYIRRGGSIVWINLTVSLVREANGQPKYFISVVEDISERKQAEARLEENRLRNRALADTMPQIVWTARPDGWFDYFNRRWFEYTGMTLEETEGWGWETALHPDDRQTCIDRWTEAIKTGGSYEIECRFKRASDGSYRWHLGRALPVRGREGRIVKWFGTCTDIDDQKRAERTLQNAHEELEKRVRERTAELTKANASLEEQIAERKLAEEALRRSEERYKLIVNHASDIIYKTDYRSGRFTFFNPTAITLLKYSEEELFNLNYLDLVRPDYREVVEGFYRSQFFNKIVNTYFEFPVVAKDGAEVWLGQNSELVIEGERVVEFQSVARDITDRKRMETSLQREREFLETVLENIGDGVVACDTEGCLTLFNQAAREFHGLSAEPIPVDQWPTHYDLYLPDGKTLMKKEEVPLFRALQGEQVQDVEMMIVPRGRPARSLIANGRALLGAGGEKLGAVVVMHDITERKQAEEALRHESNLLHALMDSIPDTIYFKDAASCFTRINKAQAKVLGLSSADEAIGKTDLDFFTPEHAGEAYRDEQQMMKSQQPLVGKVEKIRRADGEMRWVSATKVPIKGDDGATIGMVGISRDITEQKTIEEELVQTRDAALESARLKSEFLANMSHEIRTPMNGVIGMTGLLLDSELNDEQREFTETIKASADSLLTVINDILDFSKIEAGRLQFETLDFDLRSAVETSVEMFAEQAHAKRIELASLVDSDVPTELRGDPGRLRQVLTNLVGNAVKFTEQGEVVLRVTKEHETGNHVVVRFTINDTGIGISEEGQRHLFEAFRQADGSTTRKYGGTGLGLAISKQLVELMHGKIGVESTPGRGSAFWFTVKLEKQSDTADQSFTPRDDLRGMRVLVVDDNTTNRKILMHQTASWGMISCEASDGMSALQLLRSAAMNGTPYELAILDLMMPGLNGFDLARVIKSDPAISGVRLVLLPSFGQRGDGMAARQIGIDAYLTKPVKQSQLFDCLAAVMGKSSASNKLQKPAAPQLITRHNLERGRVAPLSRHRILIAEDNIVNQKVALRQVEKLGYQAEVVANGREVMEALSRISYDLILMDCQMPEMDGYEATAEIRRREGSNRHISIIAMTAHVLQGEREKCVAAGMDDYISKPVKTETLHQMLDRWLTASEEKSRAVMGNEAIVASENAPVDFSVLDSFAEIEGQPGLVNELIDLFIENTHKNLTVLQEAITVGDPAAIRREVHSLKGASSTLGAKLMASTSEEMEEQAQDTVKANLLFEQLKAQFELTRQALEQKRHIN